MYMYMYIWILPRNYTVTKQLHFVLCRDLKENIERAAAVYSQTAGLIVGNDFNLLQVCVLPKFGGLNIHHSYVNYLTVILPPICTCTCMYSVCGSFHVRSTYQNPIYILIHVGDMCIANQANGRQFFWAGWPSSALCMPSCSAES